MEWDEWITKLWVGMRLDEEELHEKYLLAGGEKDKWDWTYHTEYYTKYTVTPESVGQMISMQFGINPNLTRAEGGMDDVIRIKGLEKIKQLEDGTFVNEKGETVEIPEGYSFVQSG